MTEQMKFLNIDQKTGELLPRAHKIIAHTPMGRFGQPDDLIGTLVWLLSDASSFVTGVVVPIDGGFSSYSIRRVVSHPGFTRWVQRRDPQPIKKEVTDEKKNDHDCTGNPAMCGDVVCDGLAQVDWKQLQGTEIRFLMNKHPFTTFIEPKVSEFEKMTGIKVAMEVFPEDQYRNKRTVELNAGAKLDGYMIMRARTIFTSGRQDGYSRLTPTSPTQN